MSDNKNEKKLIEDVASYKFERVTRKEENPYVLCTLRGPCMEINKKNRNNRIYSEQLIRERILENPEVVEKIKTRSLLGEGDHPEERTSVSYPNVALAVAKLWIPDDDKTHLWGEFDVLPTEAGKNLMAIINYSGTIGISARALGSHYINGEGAEVLEASEYDFITFDAVPDPGFASARLTVREGLKRQKLLTEKNIKNIDLVLENYRSFVKNGAEKPSVPAGLGEAKQANRQSIPKSVIESTKQLHDCLRLAKQETEKLRSEKRFLLNQISEMQIGLDKAQKEISQGSQTSLCERKEFNKAISENERLLKLYRTQMQRMNENIVVLKNQLAEMEGRHVSIQKTKQKMEEKNRSFESALVKAEKENKILGQNEAASRRIIKELQVKLADAHAKAKKYLEEIDKLHSALEEHESDLEHVSGKLSDKEHQLAKAVDNNDKLKKQIDDLLLQKKELLQQQQELKDAYEQDMEDADAELGRLRIKLRSADIKRKQEKEIFSSAKEESERQMKRFRSSFIKEDKESEQADSEPQESEPSDLKKWFAVYSK